MKKNLTKPHIKIKDEKGNYVIFHCTIEEDAKPPEKIKMKSITFDFGEWRANTDEYPITFTTWEEANGYLHKKSFEQGNYLKQYFTIEYEDGKKYSGKYDVYTRESNKEERADLGAHMMTHNLFYSGRQKPHYMEEESVKGILAGTKPEEKQACADFIDRYEIKVMNQSNIFYC